MTNLQNTDLVEKFNSTLLTVKNELDELNNNIEKNEVESKELKPTVLKYKDLSEQRAILKRERKEKELQLETISQFIKVATGEESYAIFPLFQEQNSAENYNSNHIN